MDRISLNDGPWSLLGLLPGEWTDGDIAAAPPGGRTGPLPASVPGSVVRDLAGSGAIADPYRGKNTLAAEWTAHRTWVYSTEFAVPAEWEGARVRLRADRVDHLARFALNGVELGEHEGAATPALFDVEHALRWDGPNRLTVTLAPAPDEQDQLGRTSLVRTTKGRMGYWWDFCPRLVDLGLGGDVVLEVAGAVRVDDVWPRVRLRRGPDPAAGGSDGDVRRVSGDASATARSASDACRSPAGDTSAARNVEEGGPTTDAAPHAVVDVDVTLDSQTATSARVTVTVVGPRGDSHTAHLDLDVDAGVSTVSVPVDVADPALWWPNGSGEQPLYRAEVEVRTADGVSDRGAVRFGIRDLAMVANATDDLSAAPYTVVVDDEPVYLQGWNWVPFDALAGEDPAQREHLLRLAAEAGANILRVNGVGAIEDERFYDLCDELGLMVWQEFLLTSSAQDRRPSEDPGFIARVVAEARRIVPLRRHHPSLVAWGAGNELEGDDKLPLDDTAPVIGALREVVRELHPDAHWFPTSPTGRKPFNGLSSIRRDPDGLHDVHGPWLYEGLEAQYELYNAGTSLLHSEFGAEALSSPWTLQSVLPEEDLDIGRLDSPVWRHLSAWWVRPELWRTWFGPRTDLADLVAATQLLQAEGVRYAIESNRRRVPRNSGSLPWQFDEPYPMAAGTSAVDFFGRPRPAYFATAHAYRSPSLTARYDRWAWGGHDRFEAEVWVVAARRTEVEGGVVTARVLDLDGGVVAERRFACEAVDRLPRAVGAVGCALDDLDGDAFVLDLALRDSLGAVQASWRSAFSRTDDLAPMLDAPATELDVTADAAHKRVAIRNAGTVAALHVGLADGRPAHADGRARFSDSDLILLPGESIAIDVVWTGVPPIDRTLEIGALNAVTRCV